MTQRLNSPYRRWFIVRPQNHQDYLLENRVINLGVQTRLPDKLVEQKQQHVWSRYLPEGDWLAARIMVPATDPLETSEVRKPDSIWLWHEMDSGQQATFRMLQRTSHYRNIKVAYISPDPVGTVQVWCNERLVAEKEIASSRGEFDVALPDDHGSVRIDFKEGVRVFTSGMDMDLAEAFYQRTAMRIGNAPTSFEYEKMSSEDELLTLTLYRDESETNRAAIKAKVVPHVSRVTSHQPQDIWTIHDRSYDLAPLPIAHSLLIDRPGRLDSGSRCFIKLGSDMPPGKYTIEVEREDAMAGYLLLYQTVPDPQAIRRFGIHDNREL